MKKKKQKNPFNRVVFFAVVFLAIVAISVGVAISKKSLLSQQYQQMKSATLPLVTLVFQEKYETELHGYTEKMTVSAMRDTIVPLTKEKGLSFYITPFANQIESIDYALRSLDGTAYLDGGTLQNFATSGSRYDCSVTFSDLMESGKEYQLIITIHTNERDIYYYTRVIYAKTEYSNELLGFAKKFSASTYDANKADFIVNYIQPEEEAPSNGYHYIDIHSKYAMFTFSGLEVKRQGDTAYRVTELEPTQISVTLSYEILIFLDGDWKTFSVEEFFCVRYRSLKVYLLDYHRTITQNFEPEDALNEKGRIILGIGSGDYEVVTSKNGNYTGFVRDHALWSYHTKTNSLALVFTFEDQNDTSSRSTYSHHDVQVVKVADNGDIDYMVYGYMNRGIYEGKVGICFYRFSQENNATSRLFFMPVSESEQLLITDLGTLAYVNAQDVCYLRYGDGIYSIDLNSGESVEVSIRAYPGAYAMNEDGNVVAWQEGDDLTYPERLVILNMDSQTTVVVNAEDGEFVKILDFIGDDIIYGFGKKTDSIIEANMDMQQLLYHLIIASTDEELLVQQEYSKSSYYILDARAESTRIVVDIAKKNKTGALADSTQDMILLTQTIGNDASKSMIVSRNDAISKKEYYIQIGDSVNSDAQFSTSLPRFDVKDNANSIDLLFEQSKAYYVYGNGRLLYVESDINKAITEAYDYFGVVVDASLNYLWTRGTRDLVKTLSIQPYRAADNDETLAASLRVLCAQEGIQIADVNAKLEEGDSPFVIIDEAIGSGRSVNLYGCSLSEVYYFVNQGHPVIGIVGNRVAVVVVGYDTENAVLYYPASGKTESVPYKTAESFFSSFGNVFISYQ